MVAMELGTQWVRMPGKEDFPMPAELYSPRIGHATAVVAAAYHPKPFASSRSPSVMPAPPLRTRLRLSGLAVAILATVAAARPAQAFESFERGEITVAESTDIVRGREGWEICLPHLTTLTPETAAALACCAGDLDLPGGTVLSAATAAARALADGVGSVSIPHLRVASPRTVSTLLANGNVSLPPIHTIEFIAEPAADSIAARP